MRVALDSGTSNIAFTTSLYNELILIYPNFISIVNCEDIGTFPTFEISSFFFNFCIIINYIKKFTKS